MKVLCAWCNRVIGGRGSDLSHGICKRCFNDLLQAQFDFMQTMPASAPVGRLPRRPGGARMDARLAEPQPAFAGF